MTSNIFRRVCGKIGPSRSNISYSACRTLLSEAYQCKEAWQQRLQVPLLQKVDVGNFALAVQGKLDKDGQVKALDMDIIANKLEELDHVQLDFAQNMFHRFRRTNESLKMGDSTPYALIRALLDTGETERLLTMLQDKVNYGIFLDDYTANILMDHFIEKNLHKEAASIAYDMMLQESLSHPLGRHLAWYACHLRNTHWPTTEAEETAVTEEDEEEIEYIKVKFITNPWYDDHFDLNREHLLLGKTLVAVARGDDSSLGLSHHLIGLGLYEKFDRGLILLQNILEEESSNPICQQAFEAFERSLDAVITKEPPEEEKYEGSMTLEDVMPYITQEQKEQFQQQLQSIKAEMTNSGKLAQDLDLESELLARTKRAISEHEAGHIVEQLALYVEWESKREVELAEQLAQAQLELKKNSILQRLMKLQEREERLSYFDEVDQIELKMKGPPAHESIMRIQEEEQYVAAPSERGKSF